MSNQSGTSIVGVVSDTHMPMSGNLPMRLLGELEKVDIILHLGDFCNAQTLKEFQKIAPVVAVYGNADEPDLRSQLPEKKKLEINGYNLGLIHGWGPPKNLDKRVVKAFTDVDIILFGHSHEPMFAKLDDVYLFNPGSPTLNKDGSGSYGILELGENLSHRIIQLD